MANTVYKLGLISRSTLINYKQRPLNLGIQKALSTSSSEVKSKKGKLFYLSVAAFTGCTGALVHALNQPLHAEGLVLHAPAYPWTWLGMFKTYDHASIRRGYQVYKQVCSACHSLKFKYYRNLVNVSHTLEEAKAEAEESQYEDGPDDNGEMFMRPGTLSDKFPSPYKNEQAARAANSGALPPDLSYIVNARHDGENYVFSLMTGYCDPPAGVEVREGMHYNPFFPGGILAMKEPLYSEIIEYDDGTPASKSQLAKDVVQFLKWSAEPNLTERKLIGIETLIIGPLIFFGFFYFKKHLWSTIKTAKLMYRKPKY